ncbi:MAG TPA: hypothetical protein VIF62_08075 [Labilithrix sp.]|jgi:hypothetical protein
MDCAGVASLLLAYHLATTSDEERDAIDAHLLACNGCLRTYLALKRAAERGTMDRPSNETHARLRAEVARTFAKPRVVFLRRRIPLYQGLAFAAIAAAITLVAVRGYRHANVSEGVPQIDTSRPRAESLQIY